MQNRKTIFDKFMEEFVKLSSTQQYKEILEKEKRIIALLNFYAEKKGINTELLINKEIFDVNKEPTNNDYREAIMVYSQNIEEILGQILRY